MTKGYAARADGECCLTLQGHATGSVEVCAAISGIVYALAGYLKNAARKRCVQIDEMALHSGEVSIRFTGGQAENGAFEMAVIGLLQLEKQYPENICMEYRET